MLPIHHPLFLRFGSFLRFHVDHLPENSSREYRRYIHFYHHLFRSRQFLFYWSHLDLAKDSVPGMSVDKAYAELLKGKKGVKVIVGIVDSGVDIDHEDLKSVIWTNKKEIAGNGKDDDKNGYIDDIHGWNFLDL